MKPQCRPQGTRDPCQLSDPAAHGVCWRFVFCHAPKGCFSQPLVMWGCISWPPVRSSAACAAFPGACRSQRVMQHAAQQLQASSQLITKVRQANEKEKKGAKNSSCKISCQRGLVPQQDWILFCKCTASGGSCEHRLGACSDNHSRQESLCCVGHPSCYTMCQKRSVGMHSSAADLQDS